MNTLSRNNLTIRIVSKPIVFRNERGIVVCNGVSAVACVSKAGVRVSTARALLALPSKAVEDTAMEFALSNAL